MAPEYVMHGHLSAKTDVFSFGVLVLELISGQRNSSFSSFMDAENLLDWVRFYFIALAMQTDYNEDHQTTIEVSKS